MLGSCGIFLIFLWDSFCGRFLLAWISAAWPHEGGAGGRIPGTVCEAGDRPVEVPQGVLPNGGGDLYGRGIRNKILGECFDVLGILALFVNMGLIWIYWQRIIVVDLDDSSTQLSH